MSEKRYDARDFSTDRGIKNANYDRLRDIGVSRENATRIANQSVEKTKRKLEHGLGFDAVQRARKPAVTNGTTEPTTNPLRVRFPWESQDAGIDLK